MEPRNRRPPEPAEGTPPHGGRGRARAAARLEALVTLLGDESPHVAEVARDELQQQGALALPVLRRAARAEDAAVRGRARTLLSALDRRRTRRRLLRYLAQRRIELEPAFFLMARLSDPGLDARPYRKALDAFADAARERIASAARKGGAHPGLALAAYLGGEIGFTGAVDDYHHPDRIHVPRVIETRRGLPLSLCAIYVFVARRLGIRAAVLPVPGHVVLRVYGGDRPILLDPFQGGEMRTHRELLEHLARHGLAPQPAWFHDASDALLVQRQLLNLMTSHRQRGFLREAREAHRLAALVERGRRQPSA
jgi:regulator of sirC expression with transglutaminase-like and TPR domain